MRVAILDDYQGVALRMADWSVLAGQAEIVTFSDHIAEAQALIARLGDFDVLCLMRERTPIPAAVIEGLPRLKLLLTAGPYNAAIDMDAATKRGVLVCGTRYAPHAAPELTWGLILAVIRQIPREDAAMRRGGWQTSIGQILHGRTLGILGLGRIGVRMAEIGKAFGMSTIAWSHNLTAERAAECGARLVARDDLFRLSDVVTVHLQLSARTRGLIGARELGLMKPSAYLINTSRGFIIDEAALIDALQRRTIAGAALDVYDIEPLPPTHPLRHLDNLVLTPHIGFVTEETYRIFYGDMVEDIRAWLDEKPVRVINHEPQPR